MRITNPSPQNTMTRTPFRRRIASNFRSLIVSNTTLTRLSGSGHDTTAVKKPSAAMLASAVLLMLITPMVAAPPGSGWSMAWSDEFSGTSLTTSNWTVGTGARRDATNTANALTVQDGHLRIKTYTEGGQHYTGWIGSNGKYENCFGYWEARLRFNSTVGMWSAFWLQPYGINNVGNPAANGTEIDIVEHRRQDSGGADLRNKSSINVHWDGYGADHKSVGTTVNNPGANTASLQGNWHTYGLLWDHDRYRFYIDGVEVWTTTAATSQVRQWIYLTSEVQNNAWAGAIPGSGYGDRTTSTTWFDVDYVRFYQRSEQAINPAFTHRTGPWTASGSASWAATGGRNAGPGVRLNPTTTTASAFEQSVHGLLPNTEYRLIGWGAVGSRAWPDIRIGAKNHGGPETWKSISSVGFTEAQVPFTTGPSNNSARVYARVPTQWGDCFADDLEVRRDAQVNNSGFELGESWPWTLTGTVFVHDWDTFRRSGSHAMRLNTSTSARSAEQTVYGLQPNTAYTLSAWVRTNNQPIRFGVKNHGAADAFTTFTGTGNTWQKGSHTFTTGASATSATLYVAIPAGSNIAAADLDDFTLATALPSPWAASDIGTTGHSGESFARGSKIVVRGSGATLADTTDSFHFVRQPVAGDFTLTTNLDSFEADSSVAKAGIMIRASTAANSAHAMVHWLTQGKVEFIWRNTTGATSNYVWDAASVPWPPKLRLSRVGNQIAASYSTDGSTWVPVGASQSITLPTSPLAGPAICAHDSGNTGVATFSNTSVAAVSGGIISSIGTNDINESWDSAADWSNLAAPASGNDYQITSGFTIRTPSTSGSFTFPGNSLRIQTGGTLALKNQSPVTLNLTSEGGTLSHFSTSLSPDLARLQGTLVLTNPLTVTNATGSNRLTQIHSLVSGPGTLNKQGDHTLILSGDNTFGSGTMNFGSGTENRGYIRLATNTALGNHSSVTLAGSQGGVSGLQLDGGVTLDKNLNSAGRQNATTTGYILRSISGNNAWNGNVTITSSGGGYGFVSDSGTLSLGGTITSSDTSNNGPRLVSFVGAGNITVSGNLLRGGFESTARNLAVSKDGSGTLTLAGTSDYSGNTTFNNGTTLLTGSISQSSIVTIGASAILDVSSHAAPGYAFTATQTLRGNGTLVGNATTTGTIAPGLSAGTLTSDGNLTFGIGSTFSAEIDVLGTAQVETATATGTPIVDGDVTVTVTSADLGAPVILDVPILNGESPDAWAFKVRAALAADAAISALFSVGGINNAITLTRLSGVANDTTLNIALENGLTSPGITAALTSANTIGGVAPGTDLLAVAGQLDVSGATLNLLVTGTPGAAAYVIATYGSLAPGNFAAVNNLPDGYQVNYTHNSGTAIALVPTAVSNNFASWASDSGVAGGTTGDSDNDGILNLVEYALALNFNGSDGSAGTFTGNLLSFTKRPDAIDNGDVSWVIETSQTLAPDSWTPAVTQNPGDANPTISHPLPTGQGKIFGRLKVVQP
ncbi:MAG: family 16 glycosylhydrolase [Akkermansiaceae bacterium]